MASNTSHLFPDEPELSVRASLTGFPSLIFPFGGAGDLLLDQLASGWSEKARIAVIDFKPENPPKLIRQSDKPHLYISGGISSPIAYGHAVSMAINMENRTIVYRDPYGNRAPPSVTRWLRREFPEFNLREARIRQQHDHISCSWISYANIVAGLKGESIDARIQENLDDFKLRVLQAARVVWPSVMDPATTGRLSDPVRLSCFRHLTAQDGVQSIKKASKLILRRPAKDGKTNGKKVDEDLRPRELTKTFIIRDHSRR